MYKLATNIWTHDHMLCFEDGRKLPLRLTVVRLGNEKLWIHAPTPLSNELKAAISELGEVGYLFCGNNLHNMFLMEWVYTYPLAEVWVTPEIPKKLRDLDKFRVLKKNIWIDEFDARSMKSVPKFDEVVFFHYESKSLIVTDLVQNNAKKGVFLAPPLLKKGVIQDQKAFRGFLNDIKAWDFRRIVITHGPIVDREAKQKFERICECFF